MKRTARRARVRMLVQLSATLALGSTSAAAQSAPDRYLAHADTTRLRQQPWRRFTVGDSLGRTVKFYLSEEPAAAPPLPLVVYVHGSGAQSHFAMVNGRLTGRNGHSTINDVFRGRARVVMVEKPGVDFLNAPPSGSDNAPMSAAFRHEYTLDRWAEAVHAAIEAARTLPEIKAGPALLIGHSEGGIVAAYLAARLRYVTHVAVLAGGGPTQLFDLLNLARAGEFFGDVSPDPDARVTYVLDRWHAIQRQPTDADSMFFGHPFRRWHSFLQTSTTAELGRTRAAIYLAQGTRDRAVAWESFEFARAALLTSAHTLVVDAVEGADHSFSIARGDASPLDGWTTLMERVARWFLPAPGPSPSP